MESWIYAFEFLCILRIIKTKSKWHIENESSSIIERVCQKKRIALYYIKCAKIIVVNVRACSSVNVCNMKITDSMVILAEYFRPLVSFVCVCFIYVSRWWHWSVMSLHNLTIWQTSLYLLGFLPFFLVILFSITRRRKKSQFAISH